MIAASRRRRAEAVVVGEIRRSWSVRSAYGMVVLSAERASGTPGLRLWAVLRAGPRGGSGAGARVRLE